MAGAEDDIKYRQSVMRAIGGHMMASGAILQGKVPHQGDLAAHAQALAGLAGIAAHVFPTGSGEGKTHAKPEIWADWPAFERRLQEFKTKADGFAKAAAGADPAATGAAMKALGGACKDCHDKFQAED